MTAKAAYTTVRTGIYTYCNIEDIVVEHVREKWTSYTFRVNQLRESEVEVHEAIKAKMREVLQSWLSREVGSKALAAFWDRHGLLNTGVLWKMVERPDITYHGGRETVANLVSKVPR